LHLPALGPPRPPGNRGGRRTDIDLLRRAKGHAGGAVVVHSSAPTRCFNSSHSRGPVISILRSLVAARMAGGMSAKTISQGIAWADSRYDNIRCKVAPRFRELVLISIAQRAFCASPSISIVWRDLGGR